MHHGTDASVLLRRASAFPPTHLVIVNLDETLHDAIDEMAAFQPSLGVTILHVYRGEHAEVPVGEVNEAQLVRMLPDLASFELEDPYVWATAAYRYYRPNVMQALRAAFKEWSDERQSDRTVVLFVGTPRGPLDAVLLGELPLDAAALFYRRGGALPLALRLFVAPRRTFEGSHDLPLAHLVADLEQTYFGLPAYPLQFEPYPSLDMPCASPFDTTVWIEQASEVVPFLRDVLRLHGEENARLTAAYRAENGALDVIPSLEATMLADAEHRRLDWLALCSPMHAPRLWTAGLPALMAVLDMGHEKRRARDPLASIGRYTREADWGGNLLAQSYVGQIDFPRVPQEDLARADFPYRITEDDRASRLEMARHLSEAGEYERAAQIAEELLEEEPDHRLLNRLLGTDLYVSGNHARGRAILRRCIALTETDPMLDEAQRADEIATLHHLMRDFDAAISGYERAVEANPENVHAYQGLVLIHRARGEDSLADYWREAAERRGLALPLVAEGSAIEEVLDGPAPEEVSAAAVVGAVPGPADEKARERRSKWWSFFKG